MRITRVIVENLFGIFNHDIHLNEDERITIIHGPNGYGKTVMLQMIDGIFNSDFSIFEKVPFRTFRICLDNAATILIDQSRTKNDVGRITLQAPGTRNKAVDIHELAADPDELPLPLNMIDKIIPDLVRVGPRQWSNRITGELLSLEDIRTIYAPVFPGGRGVPKWLREIQQSVNVRFISSDRLLSRSPLSTTRGRERGPKSLYHVVEYSQELAGTIQDLFGKSVGLSSSLDKTFPMRLIERIDRGGKADLSIEDLSQRLRQLDEKRTVLAKVGLLEEEMGKVQTIDESVNESTKMVLVIYAQDVFSKLEIFDPLLAKIEPMQNVVNKRFAYKSFKVSRQEGFVVNTQRGEPLPLEALSSGEQHELVLLYELLFKAKQGSLILIDEPEISLHIAWQQEFLSDLREISKASNFDTLIATHSPDIINNNWNLTVKLKGPEQD